MLSCSTARKVNVYCLSLLANIIHYSRSWSYKDKRDDCKYKKKKSTDLLLRNHNRFTGRIIDWRWHPVGSLGSREFGVFVSQAWSCDDFDKSITCSLEILVVDSRSFKQALGFCVFILYKWGILTILQKHLRRFAFRLPWSFYAFKTYVKGNGYSRTFDHVSIPALLLSVRTSSFWRNLIERGG